jgi:uroporphyrinogen decarboxylase
MGPTERIIAVLDGKPVDRVPILSVILDSHPIQQILGKPLIPDAYTTFNPAVKFMLNKWPWFRNRINTSIRPAMTDKITAQGIKVAHMMDFDAIWAIYTTPWFKLQDSKTLIDVWGSYNDLTEDGHNNTYFMYRGPAITSPEAFDAWPHFPDADEVAHSCYTFFKKAFQKYGDSICIMGDVWCGVQEMLLHSVGFEKMSILTRKNPDFIQKFIAFFEKHLMKTAMAMMDAGTKVILQGDDFAFKTGPMLNPKMADAFFGDFYTRYTKAVHDRGGKILIHSCGDNTKMFDYFIKWGFDGGHAYEPTSNVNIAYEKKTHGDRFTIVGGIGIDYTLTERSKPEEVVASTKEVIRTCAPGGRFILAPTHTHPDIDMSKVKIMIETAHKYGQYPLKDFDN